MKIERSVTPSKMDKAESFINEYLKTRQNETVFSNNNKNKIDSALNSLINLKTESNEDNVNIATQNNEKEASTIINNSSEEDSQYKSNVINTNMNMVTETNQCNQNPADVFKSIADSIRNPRLTKYLDTSSSKG